MYSSHDNIWIWFLGLPSFLQLVVCFALASAAVVFLITVAYSITLEDDNERERRKIFRTLICSLIITVPIVIFWPWLHSEYKKHFSEQSAFIKAGLIFCLYVVCFSLGKDFFYFINDKDRTFETDKDIEMRFDFPFFIFCCAAFIVVCAFWFY